MCLCELLFFTSTLSTLTCFLLQSHLSALRHHAADADSLGTAILCPHQLRHFVNTHLLVSSASLHKVSPVPTFIYPLHQLLAASLCRTSLAADHFNHESCSASCLPDISVSPRTHRVLLIQRIAYICQRPQFPPPDILYIIVSLISFEIKAHFNHTCGISLLSGSSNFFKSYTF